MANKVDKIYDSGPSNPDDDFWLEMGKKMVEESLPSIHNAAAQIITGIWVMEGIYLGILGFTQLLSRPSSLPIKILLILPLLLWIGALFGSVRVLKTHEIRLFLHSPEDIREKAQANLKKKQRALQWAFWTLAAGVFLALVLILFYLHG
ncbi:MAG: hypothetical protein D6814_08795 [Calditrichaeota bacterium]|nr:MAG: hypothetical protein D6814_08795 [Calditrichota bacterium]